MIKTAVDSAAHDNREGNVRNIVDPLFFVTAARSFVVAGSDLSVLELAFVNAFAGGILGGQQA